MARVRKSIEIDRPVRQVFAFHTDPRNMTAISVNTVQYHTDGPMGPGCRVTGTTRVLRRLISWEAHVVEWSPGKGYTLRADRTETPWSLSYTYASLGPKRTRVTCTHVAVNIEGLLGRVAKGLVELRYGRDVEANLENLKSLVERGKGVRTAAGSSIISTRMQRAS